MTIDGQQLWVIRLINLDYWGRRFAQKKNSNVIIFSSSCRIMIKDYKIFWPEIYEDDLRTFGLVGIDKPNSTINPSQSSYDTKASLLFAL
jgi:hypothetical protein